MGDYTDTDPFKRDLAAQLGVVKTRSRLRMWWLCAFGGFRVTSMSQLPANTLYGGIRYTRTWHLSPRNGTQNGKSRKG